MKTILITGGAGFIGGAFVRRLVGSGEARVINLDALTYAGNLDSLADIADNPNHVFVQGDICDGPLIKKLLDEYRPDAIINFAAESHVDRSIDAPDAFLQTNIIGTHELLKAARTYWSSLDNGPVSAKDFRFLHVSTDEVYGSLGPTGAFTESTPYAPNSPYSASKASADHLVRAYHHTYGLPTLTTNCSNNYGPYQFPEKLIPLIIHRACAGEFLPVYGDGLQVRDWLYVEDHCRAILLVLDNGQPGEVYNIGGASERTNIEIVKTICTILDELLPGSDGKAHSEKIIYVTDRPGHDRRYAIDFGKIKSELGFEPHESFATGMRRTVEWYLHNRGWTDRVMSGAYRGQRLGAGNQKDIS